MTTRESIESGEYIKVLNLPEGTCWTEDMLIASLQETLMKRPDADGDVWIFAYGSLIWNPLVAHDHKERATLEGWHRSFCIRSSAGRGTSEVPGRMLSLERGGQAKGIAFRLPRESWKHELRLLWTREMITGAYVPEWVELQLDGGRKVFAIAFTANPSSTLHEGDSSPGTVGPIIARAAGPYGRNSEYLYSLAACLARIGARDEYVDELVTQTLLASHQIAPALWSGARDNTI